MKKLGLFLVISILAMGLVLLGGGTALANYGPHGGYGTWVDTNTDGTMQAGEVDPDSDACAGCHRAHTATSSITWTDHEGGTKNALLLGTPSSTLMEFCYTCHSDDGVGAATNVEAGVYDNATITYPTAESTIGAVLNGGGFTEMAGNDVTSIHSADGEDGVAWGGLPNDSTGGTNMEMDCASCHDPHGSSNYRILKDEVNGVEVGGYINGIASSFDPVADPFVTSNEVGYPTGGFRLHRNYATLTGYAPDYTSARYALSTVPEEGMSGWCAACHTEYNAQFSSGQPQYDVDDGYDLAIRHRHPVNQPLDTFHGDRELLIGNTATGLNDPYWDGISVLDIVDIPLEHDVINESQGADQVNSATDYIGCLTCHRAHGTDKTMSGYANSTSSLNPSPDTGVYPNEGVQPTMDSALLRANNRGVCERCHNK